MRPATQHEIEMIKTAMAGRPPVRGERVKLDGGQVAEFVVDVSDPLGYWVVLTVEF